MADFYRQQPTHMPLHPPPGLMSDPMSMLMLLYGPQFAEMMVGPGKFIPQLNPSQNIIDQRDASVYQRMTLANTLAAADAGNAEVSGKVRGLMALVTGEKPTELNKNTADSIAGIINNPIFKGMLGQAVGPENLEGVMFGRRGDPSALAAAVNRMGYFRQDPMGDGRMTAQSLEQFTKGLHATLYGPGANVDDMRGLMAGQTAQLMDHLFQRGTLPQSIGALAPAERARLVGGQSYNLDAVDRAAREIGHRDMMRQESYANAGAEEQKRMLERSLQQYRQIARAGSAPEAASVDVLARSLARQEMSSQGDFSSKTTTEQNKTIEDSLEEYRSRVKRLVEETNDYKKTNNTTLRDDETITRLAKEFARRELSKEESFSSAAPEEQAQIIDKNLDTYRTRLTSTLDQIETLRGADPRSMSPEQRDRLSRVEQTEEYKALASNVDAGRVGKTLKDYAGAISSVREIFGDNGSPNAPMPALLAALEQLTAGASHQMNPAKVQSVLREMRLAAKETGVGFEQLVGFTGQMQAVGDTLGIAKPLTVQNTVNSLNLIKAMEDNGAFAGNRFGMMNKQEALNEAGVRMQRGEASPVGKTMAAMARAVAENPEAYRGTEVEAAVKAYNDPTSNGLYTFNGETKNLYELAGRGGAGALAQMFANSGGDTMLLTQYYHDKGTQEFQRAGAAFQTQAHEMRRIAEQHVNQYVSTVMEGVDPEKKLTAQVAHELGQALTTEGTLLDQAERPRFLQNKATEAIRNAVKAKNPGMSDDQVEAEVQRILPSFGDTYEKRRNFFSKMASGINADLTLRTGQGLTGLGQIYNSADKAARQTVINANRARQMGFAARGHEDPLSARVGEVLNALGRGENLSFSDVVSRMLGAVDVAGFQPQHAETIGRALAMTTQTISSASFDTGEINALVERASGGDEQALAALRQLAVIDPNKTLVTDDQIQARLMDNKTYSDEDIDRLYRFAGKDPAGVDRETKVKEILKNDKALDAYFAERTDEQSAAQVARRAIAIKSVSNEEVAKRLIDSKSETQIADLYKKVIPGGTAQGKEAQAQELARSAHGAQLSGVLSENEMTMDMLRSRAEMMTNTTAGFTPEERATNERRIKQAAAINKAIQGGDKNFDLIKDAVPEVIRQELGEMSAARSKEIEERMMAVIQGTAGTEENNKAIADLKDVLSGHVNTKEMVMYTEALRDAKESRKTEDEKKVAQERRDNREERQDQQELERERARKQRADQAPLSEEEEKRAKERADKSGKDQRGQTPEAAAAEAARRAQQAAEQNKGQGGSGKDGKMEISGNLTIHNMRNAMIAAFGEQPQFSPENGASVLG